MIRGRAALCVWLVCVGVSWGIPARVVSLSPAVTDTVVALGRGADLVGITSVCTPPPELVGKISVVGAFLAPQLEAIYALSPSVVIGMGYSKTVFESRFSTLGIRSVWLDSPRTIDEIYAHIRAIGVVLNSEAEASRLVRHLKEQLPPLRPHSHRPRVVVVIWDTPLMVAGSRTFIADMVRQAGGEYAFSSRIDYPKITREMLWKCNPDIVLVPSQTAKDYIIKSPLANRLNAVRNNRVVVVSEHVFRPSPAFVLGVQDLHRIIAL